MRTAAAATAALVLAFALHLEVPALAVVFALVRGRAGAITMLVGGLAGSAAGLVLLAVLDQSRVTFSITLFVLATVGTYGALGRRFPFGWVQALLCLLILVGQSLDTPDAAARHAFFNLAGVLVAAAAAFVADATSPAATPTVLQDALAQRLRGLARLLDRGAGAPAEAVLALDRVAGRTRALLADAWPTRLASHVRVRALSACDLLVDRAHDDVLILLARERLGQRPHLAHASGAGLAANLVEAAARIAAPQGPIDGGRARRAAESRAAARRLLRGSSIAGDPLSVAVACRAHRVLARIVLLSPFLLPGARALPRLAERAQRETRPPTLDRDRLGHSVKSAAAYLLVLWAWVASEWGAIVPALVVSVLVATIATPVGATPRKALLRVGGVLAGGLAGLVVAVALLPFVTGLPAICAVVGLFLLAFQWIQQHRERLAFAALQAAIAFVLTLVRGTGPPAGWREPLESLIGLAFGIVVVVGVMQAAWPTDATTSARAALADLLAGCGERIDALLRPGRREAGATPRARAAARRARERTAGFVHEVELYGTQFGRPAEDLPRLIRPALELDALIAFLESLGGDGGTGPGRPARSDLHPVASALSRDCSRLAAGARTLPGEREVCLESELASAAFLSQALRDQHVTRVARQDTDRLDGDPLDEGLPLAAALLRDVARNLARDVPPGHRRAA